AAAIAATTVLGFFVANQMAESRLARHQHDHLHLTVSAPKAVPAGAPWSMTVQSKDLTGEPVACRVRWQAFADNGSLLAADEAPVTDGTATVAMAALPDLRVPQRVEVVATHATDEVRQVLTLSTAHAGPLVHVTTDRPVYRPGEPVFARAVVLDRVTLLPLPTRLPMRATLLDSKGAAIGRCDEGAAPAGIGSFRFDLARDSAGGSHRLQVASLDGRFPTETAEIVVRSFQAPQLKKTIVLDRTTYAPGARGAATVTAERMGGGGASGATAKATLVIDGTEVWTEQHALGAYGEATFRFTIPMAVDKGAARFVATVNDGGIVEAEVKPFVVPTGKVLIAGFPEGGELIAGVLNGLYLECTDTLGRPVDGTGEVVDERDQQVAKFRTAHQGRVKVTFVPREGSVYRVRLGGHDEPFALPEVKTTGIALRLPGTDIAADAPLRLAVAGRGDGPWLLGVFCRGVLVGQTTLRADDRGELRAETEVQLPATAAGVLRTTVFDRNLQPIAERLVRRSAKHRIDVQLAAKNAALAPGDSQEVTVRTRDESGNPIAAVVGLSVTDLAAVSLGSEPRVGLADQAMLFADVERVEELGDFLLGNSDAAQHVDLLLGTRGWRRFVWRNDAAAKAAIAARGEVGEGTLPREGFSQTPQVASNLAAAQAPGTALSRHAYRTARNLHDAGAAAILALILLLLGELAAGGVRLLGTRQKLPQIVVGICAPVTALAVLVLVQQRSPQFLERVAGVSMAPAAGEWDFAASADGGLAVFTENQVTFLAYDFDTQVALGASIVDLNGFGQGDIFSLVRRFSSRDEDPQPPYFLPTLPTHGAGGWLNTDMEGAFDSAHWNRDLAQQWQTRQYAHQQTPHEGRTDFTSTILWHTLVLTNDAGEAKVPFATSDAVTTWLVQADAHVPNGAIGRVGQAEAKFQAQLPFHLEVKLPDEVSQGDLLQLPIAAVVEGAVDGQNVNTVALQVTTKQGLRLGTDVPTNIVLQNGRGRVLLPITIADGTSETTLTLQGNAGRFRDLVAHNLRIAPRGFPHQRSAGGTVEAGRPSTFVVVVPGESVPGSGHVTLKVYPSPLTALTEGLAGILQEPHGCFEQASSSNYPNTLVLTLLDASGDNIPTIAARARNLLPKGYAKITGYECKRLGYEWFGADPGHEALTAYGLLQFHDMAKVYDVDATMVDRTKQWLLARRDGKGSFPHNFPHGGQDSHSFGGRSQPLTDAYVVYALLQAGTPASELRTEIEALVGRVTVQDATKDPYELALISCALHLAGRPEARLTRQRLAELQQRDGSLQGTTTSITSSGGRDLIVETTGFAVLAWLRDPAYQSQVRSAVEFLQTCRGASGTFGATQATITALRAITEYATVNRTMREPGTLRAFEGDRLLGERSFTASDTNALSFDLWNQLAPGQHTLRLELKGAGSALPYACDVAYHAEQPADDPDTKVEVAATLRKTTVAEGDTVALDIAVTNRTNEGQPMTLAIIGLPAGLELPTRVLEDLQKAKTFAFWELKGRELALYWRDLAPHAKREFTLDLIARIPGQSTGP
ncbi:MAG: MG2 domain-containing protein, partial [Planctomycetota bacterium]